MPKTISELIMEYFKKHKYKDIPHGPVVDWVTVKYLEYNDNPPRDPWRAIRSLHQKGFLIKVKTGVYRYDPNYVKERDLHDFSDDIKRKVLEKDNFCCVVCGRSKKDNITLTVDHIVPKDRGGTNDINNGQTLCSEHNLLKKNYSQTEAGKKYFIKMYEKAIKKNDERMIDFCISIFDVYDNYGINGHINRPNNKQ